MSKYLSDDELDMVQGMSSREAAKFLGVGKTTVNDARSARVNRRYASGALPSRRQAVDTDVIVAGEYRVPISQVVRHKVSQRDAETGSWDSVEWAPNGTPGVIEVARTVAPKVIKPEFTAAPLVGQWKTAVITADEQIGYRGDNPFHDTRAIDIAHQIIAIEQPDQRIIAGDYLDLATLSRFEQEASMRGCMQKAFDYGNELLAIDREMSPKSQIVLVEGNHDRRMQKFASDNAQDVMHVRRGNSDERWPALSVPGLLGVQELGVEYIDAYPAGMWWINDKLRVVHGNKVNSKGSTAQRYADEMPHISTVFGHSHRQEILRRTTFDRAGKIVSSYVNPGCMCRVDGEVPSVKGAIGVNGESAIAWEDWQQGLAVIRYKETGEFVTQLVEINDGVAIYERQEIHGN